MPRWGYYELRSGAGWSARHEPGVHPPGPQTVRTLAQVLKVPMAFFYADTGDGIAELLFRYGRASDGVRERVMDVLGE